MSSIPPETLPIEFSDETIRDSARLGILVLFAEQVDRPIQPGPLPVWAQEYYGQRAPYITESVNNAAEERRERARQLFGIVYAIENRDSPSQSPEDMARQFEEIERLYGRSTPRSTELRDYHIRTLRSRLGDAAFSPQKLLETLQPASNAETGAEPKSGYQIYQEQRRAQNLERWHEYGKKQIAGKERQYISPEARKDASVSRLMDALVGRQVKGMVDGLASSMAYPNEKGQPVTVALSDGEAKILINSPAHYGAKAAAQSRMRRKTAEYPLRASGRTASVRAAIHTLDPTVGKMRTYKVATLERRQAMLGKMIDETSFVGLERMGHVFGAALDLAEVSTMIDEVVDILALQQNWTPGYTREVRLTIDRGMFGADTKENRGYAKGVLTMLRDYNLHLQLLFQSRIHAAEDQIEKHRKTHATLSADPI